MKTDIKKLWIAALRSGKYKQGRGRLRDGNKFCCLGVLCDLAHKAKVFKKERGSLITLDGEAYYLPASVMVWVGFRSEQTTGPYVKIKYAPPHEMRTVCASLTWHNDNGATFPQIADAIEAQL